MAPRKKGVVEVLKEASTVVEEPDPKPKMKRKVILAPEPQSLTQNKVKRKVVLVEDEPLPKQTKAKRKVVVIEDEPKRKIVVLKEDEPTMVEEGESITVAIVHKVCLQKFKHGSKNYYLDSERDKLYEYLAEKKHGKYVGRWDSLLEEIVAGEDSDIE
jgi:hypothetical protein